MRIGAVRKPERVRFIARRRGRQDSMSVAVNLMVASQALIYRTRLHHMVGPDG